MMGPVVEMFNRINKLIMYFPIDSTIGKSIFYQRLSGRTCTSIDILTISHHINCLLTGNLRTYLQAVINSRCFIKFGACIMHQHADVGNIIGVITCNLEVIDIDGAFQNLMLDFFNNDILAVDKNQNVACAKLGSLRPTLDRRVEGMGRRCDDFLTAYKNMNQLGNLICIDFCNPAYELLSDLQLDKNQFHYQPGYFISILAFRLIVYQ